MWNVEITDEFNQWFQSLGRAEAKSVARSIELLEREGPTLGRPHVDTVNNSRHSNMKELRTQHQGRPIRSFFDGRFYERMIRIADDLYDQHLAELRKEGLI